MRKLLAFLVLLFAGLFLNGCCSLDCMLRKKAETPSKQAEPASAYGDKKPGKPIEKPNDQPQ